MKTHQKLTFHTEGENFLLLLWNPFLLIPSLKVGPESLVKPCLRSTPSKVTSHLGLLGTSSCFCMHSPPCCYPKAPAPPCTNISSNYWQPPQGGRDGFQAVSPLDAASVLSTAHAAPAYWGTGYLILYFFTSRHNLGL